MDIQKIKKLYDQNQNLTEYFKTNQNKNNLNSQEIELIYDLQSGNYSKKYENNKAHKEYKDKFTDEIIEHINNLNFKFDSILEAGIGEGTTFVNIIEKLNIPKLKSFGVDISWSRLAYANNFLKKHSIKNVKLATGLLENLPFLENTINIVYTAHSIEPNGGKEKQILKELFRVTKNYLILLEPSYEFGNDEQKERMDKLSYAKNLSKYCEELGYKIIKHELLKNHSVENNKTEIIIIEKSTKKTKTKDFLACPETKTKLFKNKNFYYSADSFYSYPILENIICLNSENKILSTKLEDFIKLEKTHPRYNEQMFLRSLGEPMDEKIKDMYCPNCIGFLAIEENLEDEEFVKYVKKLIEKFPKVQFKAFYFNEKQNKLLKQIFPNSKINFIILKDLITIFSNIEIYLCNASATEELTKYYKLQNRLRTLSCNYLVAYYDKSKNKLIKELKNNINFQKHPYVKYFDFFGFDEKDVANANENIYGLIWGIILEQLQINNLDINDLTGNELMFFKHIELGIKYTEYKLYFFNLYSKEELKRNE